MKSLLFEDSRYIVIRGKDGETFIDKEKVIVLSEMLCRCYVNNNNSVLFSNGSELLKDVVNTLDDDTLLYVDVVPDNIKTMSTYLRLMQHIVYRRMVNIYIIPIPCIEYFVIQGFGDECIEKSIVVNREKYLDTKVAKHNLPLKCKTFEKFCKAVMSVIVPDRFQGSVLLNKFSIKQEESLKLLTQLLAFYEPDVKDFSMSKIHVKDIIREQYKLLIEQYQRYAESLVFEFDMKYLNEVFTSYIDLIEDVEISYIKGNNSGEPVTAGDILDKIETY